MRAAALLLPMILALAVGCGGDDDEGGSPASQTTGDPTASATATATATATDCATGDGDPGRTVVLRVDDEQDGFGSFGSRTPTDLAAGPVRLAVEADPDNDGPVDVVVTGPDGFTTTIAGVPPGETCGLEVELAAGDYVATSSANADADTEFTVVP